MVDHIHSNIKQDYVMSQVEKVFKDTEEIEASETTVNISQSKLKMNMNTSPNDYEEHESCPSCNSRLIITEGCNMCIECGFSSCMSG